MAFYAKITLINLIGVIYLMNILKKLRKKKGDTQKELSDNTGISYRSIQRWENNKTPIKPDKAQILADYFKVRVDYLLGYSEIADPKLYELTRKMTNEVNHLIIASKNTEKYLTEKALYYEYEPVSKRLITQIDFLEEDLTKLFFMMTRYPVEEFTKEEREALRNLYEKLQFFSKDIPASFDYFESILKRESESGQDKE